MKYSVTQLNQLTIEWSKARGIIPNGNVNTQMMKLMSELGELNDNLAKGRCIKDDIGDCMVVLCNMSALMGIKDFLSGYQKPEPVIYEPRDQVLVMNSVFGELSLTIWEHHTASIGTIVDCVVCLDLLATSIESSVEECWSLAYNSIKDRKGYLNENGTFIKDGDNA